MSRTKGDILFEDIMSKKESAASVAKPARWSRHINNKELEERAAKAKEAGVSYGNYVIGNVHRAFNPAFSYAEGYECKQKQTCLWF